MILHSVRHALRLLRRSPGFTTLAVSTLALGIGANTAIFSVIDAVILRPLPYPSSEHLVAIWEVSEGQHEITLPGLGRMRPGFSPIDLVDYNQRATTLEGLAGYNMVTRNLTGSGTPEALRGEAVTWNYCSVLGMQPAIGRCFSAEEDRAGESRVVVLSDSLWRARYGGNASVLGRQIDLDGRSYTVIGVMPPDFEGISGFRFPGSIRFLIPAADQNPAPASRRGGYIATNVIGRLAAGVTIARAQADLDAISASLAREFPGSNGGVRAEIAPLGAEVVRYVETSLLILLGASGLLLLVACVNVTNLLLVRAAGQQRDIAIRIALGATRGQIVGELLTRGIVLGIISGAAGLLFGVWTRDALIALAPATIPRLQLISLSMPVLGATAVLSLLSGVLAALIPALQASRRTASTLSQTATTVSAAPSILRWRGMLVAGEIAAAVILATGAGLLVRSLALLNRVPLGYDTRQVLVAGVNLPTYRYKDTASKIRFFDALTTRVRTIPGVQSTAFASEFPLNGQSWDADFKIDTLSGPVQGFAGFQSVSPDYFSTLGIPVIKGRAITEEDRPGSSYSAVISETLAKKLSADVIGLQLDWDLGQHKPAFTIVGVAGEIRRQGRLADPVPQIYFAAKQTTLPVPGVAHPSSFAVRATGDVKSVAGALQKAVWATDPDQAVGGIQTLEERLNGRVADRQFQLALLSSLALLTLTLALVGCYGVVAFAAAERTREIGIRLAFGASRQDVIRLVVGSGLRWSLVGVAAGLLGAVALTRFLKALLFAVTPTDPLTFIATAGAVMAVACVASYIPARRAAAIDPVRALRVE